MSLEGRISVVTGASRGIGRAVADAMEAEGARTVRLARGLSDNPGRQRSDYRCDVTVDEDVARVGARILDAVGVPDVVVNNAGAFLIKPLADTSAAEMRAQLEANVVAVFSVVRAFLPAMMSRGSGHFITVGSVADHVAYPGNAAYAASKFGVRGLHEAIAAELKGTGIRASLVSPGPTDTAIWDPFDPDGSPDLPARGDMLRPEDVAEAVVFAATRRGRANVEWMWLMPVA